MYVKDVYVRNVVARTLGALLKQRRIVRRGFELQKHSMRQGDFMSISAHKTTRPWLRSLAITLSAGACLLAAACASDEVLGDDEAFMSEQDTGDDDDIVLEPNGCDMTGTWMGQIYTVSEAMGTFQAEAYNWFYYEIEDNGDEYVDIKRSFDCSFVVCGSATEIDITHEQDLGLTPRNRQDGILKSDPDDFTKAADEEGALVDPRKIRYAQSEDGVCEFSMERWWSVRSAPLKHLPPRDEYSTMSIGQMQSNEDTALPPKTGYEDMIADLFDEYDWDKDGSIGLNLQLDKPTTGWRDAIQRDWNEVPTTYVADGLFDFTVPAIFDNEETVYDASVALLDQESTALQESPRMRLVRIDEQAPESDLEEILAFCEAQVQETFKNGDHYCDLPKPKVRTGLDQAPEGGGDGGDGGDNGDCEDDPDNPDC